MSEAHFSYVEKKRPRFSFSNLRYQVDFPPLVRLQKESFERFHKYGVDNAFKSVFPIESSSGNVRLNFKRSFLQDNPYDENECRERMLTYMNPVYAEIELEILDKGGRVKSSKSETVFMGELPRMTETGSFIINGTERVVVSQLHRSPGVFFTQETASRVSSYGRNPFSARIIPYEGCWIDFEFDQKDILYFRIDRNRKMPVTIFLKALGYSEDFIIEEFYRPDFIKLGQEPGDASFLLNPDHLINNTLPYDVIDTQGNTIVHNEVRIKKIDLKNLVASKIKYYGIEDAFLYGHRLRKPCYDASTGELIARANAELKEDLVSALRAAGIDEIEVIHTNDYDCGPYISHSMTFDEKMNPASCREAIYRVLRPGDPPSPESVYNYLETLLFDVSRYNLSEVGRMKLNRRLNINRDVMEYRVLLPNTFLRDRITKERMNNLHKAFADCKLHSELAQTQQWVEFARMVSMDVCCAELLSIEQADEIVKKLNTHKIPAYRVEQLVLSRKDILDVVKTIINLRNGHDSADDIDNLANRRVRSVGEFLQNYFKNGIERVQRAIKDRLSRAEMDNLMPHDLISARAVSGAVAEFFNGNQLSQFMDHTNCLSAVTHKRRVSALGIGALNRDRAGFEVRDVHPTHYGRVCPIETPEGPNIGLINSMTLYASVNNYGFLQTSYFKVNQSVVSNELVNMSVIEEGDHVIAQATDRLDKNGKFIDELIAARKNGEFVLVPAEQVTFMDVAPGQISSVAAALIPFLEHNDANRALMGSNMQRQAVPCLKPEKPLIGTGIEKRVAEDSQEVLCAKRAGIVDYVDAKRIVIRTDSAEVMLDEFGVDVYHMVKYYRSNQNTSINNRPIVKVGDRIEAGDVIADGSSTDFGELALGQNLRVAFVPWYGYNFEDSIAISEKVVIDERFSSVHVIEEIVYARDTKLGEEHITKDIPNLAEHNTAQLDDYGIVRIGTEVHPGDILVGKVTPKGEKSRTQEERLLMAVFGEKAAEVKNTSLRMSAGAIGTVIDVKIITAGDYNNDSRVKSIIDHEMNEFKKDSDNMLKIIHKDAATRIARLIVGQKVDSPPKGIDLKKGAVIKSADVADLRYDQIRQIKVDNEELSKTIKSIVDQVKKTATMYKNRETRKLEKLHNAGNELPQGVRKMIKVYIAVKRRLQVGDKMAGRHGNKGVVSKVVPVEDMPYSEDGVPVDIVLSPLGVPSRMNIGQVLETHLGFAAKGLGDKLNQMIIQESKNQIKQIRTFLNSLYNRYRTQVDFSKYSDDEIIEMAQFLRDGVTFSTPIFDGAKEEQIVDLLKLADLPEQGKIDLYDGLTGEKFDMSITVGYMYIFKLHHLVDEKMHARSTGPYSLVTQQPLGGKAQSGGQRFGEMEVWALEAYGAAYTLCEMLTVKSDDVFGRMKIYDGIVNGTMNFRPDIPESFNVLLREVRALGIEIDFQ